MFITDDAGLVLFDDAGEAITLPHLTMDSFSLTSGTFDPNGVPFEVTGNFSISGTGAIAAGNDVWNGVDLLVGGNFSVADTGTTMNLRASAEWMLVVLGNATADNVDVSYCDAGSGRSVSALNSTDSGNNQNWSFGSGSMSSGHAMGLSIAIGV